MDPAGTAPTGSWRIEPGKLREAAEVRRRDPNDLSSALLSFGFGARDDGAAIARMRPHPKLHMPDASGVAPAREVSA